MGTFIDLTGQRFGRLVALRRSENTPNNRVTWLCRCDCGTEKIVAAYRLRDDTTKSCGCLGIDIHTQRLTKHGKYGTRIYRIWHGMVRRCANPTRAGYARYGGRGIAVSDRWHSFDTFLADMGEPPTAAHSLDRIDNNGPYAPDNCRWATPKEQSANSKRPTFITHGNRRLNLSEWAAELGLNAGAISNRIRSGWPPELAVTTPPVHRTRSPMRQR